MANKIYIPTFISSIDYQPVKVLPHIYFYNGTKVCEPYYVEGFTSTIGDVYSYSLTEFPYFDNYAGNDPTTGSKSLLFFNEPATYGQTPTASLYSEYWSKYVELLYNPKTRLIECSAIIPLADYFKMELNDIVEWRGNYYHLRAINDYNLSNGECTLQLLGPILADTIANIIPVPQEVKCEFDFDIEGYTPPTPTSSLWDLTKCDDSVTFYGVSFDTTSSLSAGQVITFGTPAQLDGCFTLATSSASPDLTGSIVYGIYDSCVQCSGSAPPTGSDCLSCTGSAGGSYAGLGQHYYPIIDLCDTLPSNIEMEWNSYDRPNRFTVYDNSGQLGTTGWVGYANYAGPWGLSLNTAQSGYMNITFGSLYGRYILVEAGPAGPDELSDSWNLAINCF